MPRQSLGPRLYFDSARQNWVIRDGHTFIRTGAAGWKAAEYRFREYLKDCPLERRLLATSTPKPVAGFVYFLTADFPDFPIKIGFTQRKGDLRSKDLQTSCPFKLVTLGTFPGGYADERKMQRQFADQRLEGEWFARSPDLMDLVAALKAASN